MYEKDPAEIINFHRTLLADKVRTESYQQAIFETVKAGDVVLDLGSGTGILAFFACHAGAQKVYAIEVGEVIEIAKIVCFKNRLQDHVVFLNDLSSRIDLPERVDVIVTETMGNFGLDEGLLGSVIDARKRFLKESGIIIPNSIELFIVPVELPEVYQSLDIWTDDLYGVDFSPIRPFAINNLKLEKLHRGAFLSEPTSLVQIKLSEVKSSDVCGKVSFITQRRGVLHEIFRKVRGLIITGFRRH